MLSVSTFIFFSKNHTHTPPALSKKSTSVETVESLAAPMRNTSASFAIFTNRTFRVFTSAMYHQRSQDVYIEASDPNIIQVKKSGTTWNDFFSTLPFKLTPECLTTGSKERFCTGNRGILQFYLNGLKKSNVLDQEIKDGDKLLVTFGTESKNEIEEQIDRVPQVMTR